MLTLVEGLGSLLTKVDGLDVSTTCLGTKAILTLLIMPLEASVKLAFVELEIGSVCIINSCNILIYYTK